MSNTQPVVLITGATDGIGLALARQYQQRNARLVLLGRRDRATLDSALFTADSYCQVDLARPNCAATVAAFFQQRAVEHLDLLIHNAGVGFYGAVTDQPVASIRELVAVNLQTPIALTHTLLPHLERARGQLVFISSVVSALPVPQYAVYGATKAALDGFARSLRIELHGKILVQVIHPGATRTKMHARSGAPISERRWRRFPASKTVAAQIIAAIDQRRPTATIGRGNQVLRFAGRYLDWLIDRVIR
ncbi:MAG: SDR family NAD(P)-dependent oxidoreductase [Chloroflexales bacterium]|nr:SDR family NAD(P)-dependent oxidoreductase [Chloroflexales bacterium]